MFTDTDYDKLRQLMAQSPENEALIQKLLDSQEETISTISHEIRNPLTLVYSTVQLIQSQHPEVEKYKYWSGLCEDIEYMKHLLEELSAYNHSSTLFCTDFDFRCFMEHLVLSFASLCADGTVEFTSRIDPSLPVINADRIKLREALINLLQNARDAISIKGTISLDAVCYDGIIRITIRDSGCGISQDDLPHIFDPFVTYKQGGTGLGLSITKRVVDTHHGQITVDSALNTGTTITVTLPVKQKSQ